MELGIYFTPTVRCTCIQMMEQVQRDFLSIYALRLLEEENRGFHYNVLLGVLI